MAKKVKRKPRKDMWLEVRNGIDEVLMWRAQEYLPRPQARELVNTAMQSIMTFAVKFRR